MLSGYLLGRINHGYVGEIPVREREEAHQQNEYVIGMYEDWKPMAWIRIAEDEGRQEGEPQQRHDSDCVGPVIWLQ